MDKGAYHLRETTGTSGIEETLRNALSKYLRAINVCRQGLPVWDPSSGWVLASGR
jgi:hypothetical protein